MSEQATVNVAALDVLAAYAEAQLILSVLPDPHGHFAALNASMRGLRDALHAAENATGRKE